MSGHRWGVALFVLACVAGDAAVASAQTDPSRDAEARGLFDAGLAAFADGRFDDAYAHFERSYALSGRPQLLFNLAATCERLRRDAEAVVYYERYLAEVPDAENRRFVEGRITLLREAVARSTAASPPPNGDGAARGPEATRVPDPAGAAATVAPIQSAPAATARDDADRRRTRRRAIWISVAALAAGGLAAGLAIALHDGGTEAPIPGAVGAGGVVVTRVGASR